MGRSTSELRTLWRAHECAEGSMVMIPFGPDRIRVAPETADAWDALATVMLHHGYEIRTADTDSYNCRNIKNSGEKSLHAFGIALDVNWTTNPFLDHAGRRKPRFSAGATQAERAEDVRLGNADTDMTEAMIADIAAIRTKDGLQVFDWGGSWRSLKDAMHFEIDLSPEELAAGIDPASVAASDVPASDVPASGDFAVDPGALEMQPFEPSSGQGEAHVVVARSGLRLRAGPSTDFEILDVMPAGMVVEVTGRVGDWASVDLKGDGLVDGFSHGGFLKALDEVPETLRRLPEMQPFVPSRGPAEFGEVTPEKVKAMFPATGIGAIRANLPFVLAGLEARGLTDRPMLLMALATIRAETEGFVPISEGQSRFNTAAAPFDLYDTGTRKGRDLGNTEPGDGPRFRGRGYVQLTGRFNYDRVGREIGIDLCADPEKANDPATAGHVLAQFLANQQGRVRAALAAGDLRAARRAVNGGSHGLARFEDAFWRGEAAL